LVFGATADRPLDSRRLQARADEAWRALRLTGVTLHACRHLYASNAHALCRYMGHSSIAMTSDLTVVCSRQRVETEALLDAYLERTFASPVNRIGSL
jgi:integrase